MLIFDLTNVPQISWSIDCVYIFNLNVDYLKDGFTFPEDKVKWDGWALGVTMRCWVAFWVSNYKTLLEAVGAFSYMNCTLAVVTWWTLFFGWFVICMLLYIVYGAHMWCRGNIYRSRLIVWLCY